MEIVNNLIGDCAGLRANLDKTQLFGLVLGMVVASNTYLIVAYFGSIPENSKSFDMW
jgi:tetrahydromethanopterin S-methyltransferase subunit F